MIKQDINFVSINIRIDLFVYIFFFFNDTATTEIYTLSLHDALPIYGEEVVFLDNENKILVPIAEIAKGKIIF